MTPEQIHERLSEPFPSNVIHWRVGATTKDKKSGIALAYIDARDVMTRLDSVLGVDGWQDDYKEVNGAAVCNLKIWLKDQWIIKSDGAGQTSYEGEKGQFSDAFKRAAARFGIGRYLYALSNEWVPIKAKGKSFVIITPPKLPRWATADTPTVKLNNALEANHYKSKTEKTKRCREILSRPISSSGELSEAEIFKCIDALGDESINKLDDYMEDEKENSIDPLDQLDQRS